VSIFLDQNSNDSRIVFLPVADAVASAAPRVVLHAESGCSVTVMP
jgi:hypothetical protein